MADGESAWVAGWIGPERAAIAIIAPWSDAPPSCGLTVSGISGPRIRLSRRLELAVGAKSELSGPTDRLSGASSGGAAIRAADGLDMLWASAASDEADRSASLK